MNPFPTSPRYLRLGLAVALVAAASGFVIAGARADLDLPPVSAERLLASTIDAAASDRPVSGTVEITTALGLPELPQPAVGGTGPDVLLGDETFRVWRSAEGVRVAHLARFDEQVLTANADEAWLWDSSTFTATRFDGDMLRNAVASDLRGHGVRPSNPESPALTAGDPLEIARLVLDGIAPYAVVDVARAEEIAGRAAYTLELRPRSATTVIGRIDVSIDAETRIPLRLEIFSSKPAAADPVIQVGFTSVSFDSVDPALFRFEPPAGATLESGDRLVNRASRVARAVERRAQRAERNGQLPIHGDPDLLVPPNVRLFGKGFELIVAVRVEDLTAGLDRVLPFSTPLGSGVYLHRGGHGWVVAGPLLRGELQAAGSRLP